MRIDEMLEYIKNTIEGLEHALKETEDYCDKLKTGIKLAQQDNTKFIEMFQKLKLIECTIGQHEQDKASYVGQRVTKLHEEMKQILNGIEVKQLNES